MRKKILIVLIAVVSLAFIGSGLFYLRYRNMADVITAEVARVGDVDLSKIPDGVYKGSFGEFLVQVDLEASVVDHRIAGIKILRQECGPGYEALKTVDRIIAAQSPKVDAVTGATGSSSSIMIATWRALQGK